MWSLNFESRLLELARERGLVKEPASTESLDRVWLDPQEVAASTCWGPRLDALLRQGALDEGSLNQLAWEAVHGEDSAPSTPPQPELTAFPLRFQELSLVGEGATAHVYRAFDTFMQRWVALKQLKSTHPDHRRRLLDEARAQAQVDHPHVCKVFEVAESEGGAYILLQLAEAGTLAGVRERLSPAEKVRLVREVAQGVHAAHQRGLLHLDLKPGNILLQEGAHHFHPLVGDFGMVRSQGQGLCPMGTPPYSSPEQLDGDLARVDGRSDVYALGMLLYVLLAGRFPFEAASFPELLGKARTAIPNPLPQETNPWGRDLEAILGSCLAKHPDGRYPTAQALAEDLDRLLKKLPVIARAGGVLYRLGRWRSRNPRLAFASTALTFSLAVGGVATYQAIQARSQGEWAQHFEAEAAELEAYVYRIWTLPAHDLSAEMDVARDKVKRLEQRVEQAKGIARGPAHYALGRAYRVVDIFTRRIRSFDHLKQAYDLGFRTPEVRVALAHAYLDLFLWLKELDSALRGAPLAMEERHKLLGKLYLEPARPLLSGLDGQGKGWSLEAEILKSLAEGNARNACKLADNACKARPWDFQVYSLAISAHINWFIDWQSRGGVRRTGDPSDGMITNDGDLTEGRACYQALRRLISERRRLAPGLPLDIDHMEQDGGVGRDLGFTPNPDEDRDLKEASANLALDDRDPFRKMVLAWAIGTAADQRFMIDGRDPRPGYREAIRLMEEIGSDQAWELDLGVTRASALGNLVVTASCLGDPDLQAQRALRLDLLNRDWRTKHWREKVPGFTLGPVGGNDADAYWASNLWESGEDPFPFLDDAIRWVDENPVAGDPSNWSLGTLHIRLTKARYQVESGQEPQRNWGPLAHWLSGERKVDPSTSWRDIPRVATLRSQAAWIEAAWKPTRDSVSRLAHCLHHQGEALDNPGRALRPSELRPWSLERARIALWLLRHGSLDDAEKGPIGIELTRAIRDLAKVFPADPEIPELEARWLLTQAKGDLRQLQGALKKCDQALVYPKPMSDAEYKAGARRPIPAAFQMTGTSHQGRTLALKAEVLFELARRSNQRPDRKRWTLQAVATFEASLRRNPNLEHQVRPLLQAAKELAATL